MARDATTTNYKKLKTSSGRLPLPMGNNGKVRKVVCPFEG